ncbi:MAG: cation transporter [Betaproteobacteria bacterium]|nr:MAG: cation transporter [Betaproteobacteria bacterium]
MTEFRIDDMPCRHCASAISRAVWSLDAAATVVIDHASKRVRVESPLGPYKLAAAIAGAGFAPSAVRPDAMNVNSR